MCHNKAVCKEVVPSKKPQDDNKVECKEAARIKREEHKEEPGNGETRKETVLSRV